MRLLVTGAAGMLGRAVVARAGAAGRAWLLPVDGGLAARPLQVHGGPGYMSDFPIERLARDVRITTIYEGTSEIQQSIIGTHRWRMVVKTRGGFYRDMATSLRELGTGEAAALAADGLAVTVLACHTRKLPREQWVMFELARLAAEVETAVALARKAARDTSSRKELLMACARLHGSGAARDVAVTGLRLLLASGRYDDDEVAAFKNECRFDELLAASDGELEQMNVVARALEAETS